jgi:hypothetical protein
MEPFSKENLSKIFQVNPKISNRLISRESSTIEFKSNFHLGRELNRYGRTMAAFANANGGYLIYGVADKPRTLMGMTNKKFVDLEPHVLTEFLNNKFSPEIAWDAFIHYIGSKEFGIIYTYESLDKPIIAKSDGGNVFQEGDILYRYRARTERIKYSELRNIIEEQKQNVHDVWFKHLTRISKIGAENAAIFDPNSGTVTGKSGQFIIDKKILPKLRFIKEGEFKEVTGKPAIRVVGDAKVLATGEISAERTKIETRVIHSADIIIAFLKQQKVNNPVDYITEICHGSTAYMPMYYFMKQAGYRINDAVESVKCNEHCNLSVKSRLIDRLSLNDPRIHYSIPKSDTPLTLKKWSLRKNILEKKLKKKIEIEDLRQTLYVIQTLKKDEIDIDYLFPILLYWYKNLWSEIRQVSQTEFRKAICHLDYVLYRQEVEN